MPQLPSRDGRVRIFCGVRIDKSEAKDGGVLNMMKSYGVTKERAEQCAIELRKRIGQHALYGYTRTATGYIVQPYPGTDLFGVVERWTYDNRPELGEFGGAFVLLMP